MYRWDDVKVYLAALDHRSLARAATVLGITAATASRRLARLEADLGTPLFQRTPEGLVPTRSSRAAEATARTLARFAERYGDEVRGLDEAVEGTVRLAMPPFFAGHIATGFLPGLLERHPRLSVALQETETLPDLLRGEADLALFAARPEQPGLVARRLAITHTAIFAAPGYLERSGERPLGEHVWVGWGPSLAHRVEFRWLTDALPGVEPRLRTDTLETQAHAVRAGVGVSILPRICGRIYDLIELSDPALPPTPNHTIWMVMAETSRGLARVQAVAEWLGELFATGRSAGLVA